jgi:hypothetical protein
MNLPSPPSHAHHPTPAVLPTSHNIRRTRNNRAHVRPARTTVAKRTHGHSASSYSRSSRAHFRSTPRSCSMRLPRTSTRNVRAGGGSCVSCAGSGLGLLLLLMSRCRASRAACSLCVWVPCGTSWRGYWLVIRADGRVLVPFGMSRGCMARLWCPRNHNCFHFYAFKTKSQAIPRANAQIITPSCLYNSTTYPLVKQARHPNLA